MKSKISVLLAAVFLFTLTGCQGYREIDTEYLVSAVGFEYKNSEYNAFAEVLVISSDKKESESKLFFSAGSTPFEAISNISATLPKKAVFDHCGTAVAGDGIKGKRLKNIIKYLYDTKNLNLGICLYTARDVRKVLSCNSEALCAGYDIMAIKSNIEKVTGTGFKNKYYEICGMQISSGVFCLPCVTEKNGRPAISGQTVYRDFNPVCMLDGNEAIILNLLIGGSKGGEINIAAKKCTINRITPRIKTESGALYVNLKCDYRQKGARLNGELKIETEKVLNKLKNAAALNILQKNGNPAAGKIEVKAYD